MDMITPTRANPDKHVSRIFHVRKGLYLTFFAALVIAACAGFLVFGALKESQQDTFDQRINSILHSLGQLGGLYITSFDWPLLEHLVERTASDPIVDSVLLEDTLSGRSFGKLSANTEGSLIPYSQAINEAGRSVGRVHILIDDSTLQQTLGWLRSLLWFAVVTFVLIFTGLAYILMASRAHIAAINQEIAERQRAEVDLRKLSMAVEQSPASVIITDKNSIIEYVNPKFLEVTGYTAEEIIGKNPGILNSGLTPEETYRELREKLSAGREWRGEFNNRKKNGETFWEYASVSPIRADDGSITHYLSVKEDITLRKDYEARLLHQASYDSLTGLANRIVARDRLQQAVKQAHRNESMVGLLFIDLDHFKKVNDTLGHATGDQLLVETARRLRSCMREQDTIARLDNDDEYSTVARLGGDEFAVILQDMYSPLDAEVVADRILRACAKPFLVSEQELFLSASIGVTVYPGDAKEPEILMRNADAAMYQAKEEGRGAFRYFSPEINDAAQERLQLENELRHGFAQGELELYFQPLYESYGNTLEGAEALLRWRSPTRGLVPPDCFIPLAENTGLIVPIGDWVLHTACQQVALWREHCEAPLYVSVNISTRQFQQSDLVASVTRAVQESSLPPECLILEITETVLLEETEKTKATFKAIHDLGVRFSIDDFGIGYSSLSYLRNYPFEYLKIDRSFISNVMNCRNDANLVESIIAMALNLNLKVVAEGIENDEQYDFIKNVGCATAQGFGLCRPVPAEDFLQLVSTGDACLGKAPG